MSNTKTMIIIAAILVTLFITVPLGLIYSTKHKQPFSNTGMPYNQQHNYMTQFANMQSTLY
jgi:hypothetical protein